VRDCNAAQWARRLRDDPRITGTTLLVGLIYATYCGAPGKPVWPSNSRLGVAVGLRRETVGRSTRQLVNLGYLTAVNRVERTALASRWLELQHAEPRVKVYRLTIPGNEGPRGDV
jgi:hypothetical protein